MKNKLFKILLILMFIMISFETVSAETSLQNPLEKSTAAGKVKSLEDLANAKIGVLSGSTHDLFVSENYPSAVISRFNSAADLTQALLADKIDAVINDSIQSEYVVRENPSLTILPDKVFKEDFGFGFSKGNEKLCEQFNVFLKEIHQNGVYDEMYNRWFSEETNITMPTFDDAVRPNGKVVFGTSTAISLPFVGVSNGKYIGFDMELTQRFAAHVGIELEIKDFEFAGMLLAGATGKIDFFGANVTITPERQKQMLFSDPYCSSVSTITVKKTPESSKAESTSSVISAVSDLSDKRIGVLIGSIQDLYATKEFPNAKIERFSNSADMPLALKNNQIDAIIFPYFALKEISEKDDTYEFLTKEVFAVPTGHAFNKSTPELTSDFNKFLSEIKSNGIYDDIYNRYIVENNFKMPDIPTEGDNGTYTVGIYIPVGLPYASMVNGEYTGIDVEIAKRFAASQGKQLVVQDIEFAGLIASLAAGKVDSVAGSMGITEERLQQVDFSDNVYMNASAILTTKEKMGLVNSSTETQDLSSPSFFEKISKSIQSNLILEKRYLLIADGIKATIIISIFAALFGTVLGALICLFRLSKNILLRNFAKLYIGLIRGIPVLVLLMIIYYVVFASSNVDPVVAAIIAFGLNFAAYVSEMFRTGISAVDKGQMEAGIASGFSPVRAFLYIIFPQSLRHILPVYKGEFISLVKMTSIVGYIAVQDLTKAGDIIRSRTFDAFFPLILVAVLYFIIAYLLTYVLSFVEIKVDPKIRRRERKE